MTPLKPQKAKKHNAFDITAITMEFRRDMTLELEKIHRALDEIEQNIDRLESSLVAMMRDLAKIKAATITSATKETTKTDDTP